MPITTFQILLREIYMMLVLAERSSLMWHTGSTRVTTESNKIKVEHYKISTLPQSLLNLRVNHTTHRKLHMV